MTASRQHQLAITKGRSPKRLTPERIGGRIHVGQSVTHPKFGLGVIVSADGGGNDVRVQVNFGSNGMKWLALSMARLEPV